MNFQKFTNNHKVFNGQKEPMIDPTILEFTLD